VFVETLEIQRTFVLAGFKQQFNPLLDMLLAFNGNPKNNVHNDNTN
jgi:hypothetical protein